MRLSSFWLYIGINRHKNSVDIAFLNEVSLSIINNPTRYGMNREDYYVILERNLREHQMSQHRQKVSDATIYIKYVRRKNIYQWHQTQEYISSASDTKIYINCVRCKDTCQLCQMQKCISTAFSIKGRQKSVRCGNIYQLHQM